MAFKKTFFVGVGAQKCGTTWLYRYLADHPQFLATSIKELHFFDMIYRRGVASDWDARFEERLTTVKARIGRDSPPRLRKLAVDLRDRIAMNGDPESYRAFFLKRLRPVHRVFGEISPGYASLPPEGHQAIRSIFPIVRVAFLMRDPVDRVWSSLQMYRREGGHTAMSDLLTDPKLAAVGHYQRALENLDKIYAPGEVWIGFYESLFSQPAIDGFCDWLGIDRMAAAFDIRVNAGDGEPITAEDERLAFDALRSEYDFCRTRFGNALPPGWRTN